MSHTNPLISVFIPYYNDEKFLKESIESVLNQTYENFELILLNHNSQDSSREIAHSYNDKRIKHIDMPYNLGLGGSGLLTIEFLKVAQGKYTKPFCADDIMLPDCLEKLVNYMENNPDKDFAFGNLKYVDEYGNDLGDDWFSTRERFEKDFTEAQWLKTLALGHNPLPYIGAIIKRSVLNQITINTTFVIMFDMSLWTALLCKKCKIGIVNEAVCSYRQHTEQVCSVCKHMFSASMAEYEWTAYWELFLQIDDIELVKAIWSDSPFVTKLTQKEDIPFFIAHSMLNFTPQPLPYGLITKLLDDEKTRLHLQETFGYGVRELRQQLVIKGQNKNKFKNFKECLYNKKPKELCLCEVIFLLMKKGFDLFSLKTWQKLLYKKKKYTV